MLNVLAALLLCLLLSSHAYAAQRFIIGTEDINFYPHYDFTSVQGQGFANDVLRLFAEEYGYQFSFQPLPVKRLYHELDNLVDFIYPDNPNWAKFQGSQQQRLFSEPLVQNWGTTLVLPKNKQLELAQVRTLAVIHGFTPVAWLALKPDNKFKFYEVPNAVTAINMVLKGQLDAADVEYHVARHILARQQQSDALVVADKLPMTRVNFHLSTIRHPQVLAQFNQFLLTHQNEIAQIKAGYNLADSPF